MGLLQIYVMALGWYALWDEAVVRSIVRKLAGKGRRLRIKICEDGGIFVLAVDGFSVMLPPVGAPNLICSTIVE